MKKSTIIVFAALSTLLASTYFGGSPENGYEPSGLCLDTLTSLAFTTSRKRVPAG